MKSVPETIRNRAWLQALVMAVGFLFVGIFLAWYNNKVIPGSTNALAHYPAEPGNPLHFLAEWDSRYFIGIAQHSYKLPSDPAFFPLYPLLIRSVSFIVRSPLISALLVSWCSLFGAIYFYIKLLPKLWTIDLEEKLQSTLFFLLFPTAIFMLAVYSEALFVCLSLAALYFCLTQRYWISSLMLIGATATRVTGVLTVIFIGLLMLEQRQSIKRIIAVCIAGLAGILAYSVFLQLKFHNFLQYVAAEKYWGRFGGGYFNNLHNTASLLSIITVLLVIWSVYFWARHRRYSFAVYSLLFLALPVATGQFTSLNRFVLADFPIMFGLFAASQRKPVLRVSLLCLSAMFWTYFLLQYAGGYNGG